MKQLQEYSKPKIPSKFYKAVDHNLNSKSYITYDLEKMGWRCIGNGGFANVYGNPNKDYVLKITYNPDPAYAYYVSLIKKLHNKHLPVISDLKRITINGRTCYIYLIEKLRKAGASGPIIANGLDLIMKFYDVKNLKEILDKGYNSKDSQEWLYKFFKKNPDLLRIARILGKNKNKIKNSSIDMHDGNIMERNDGTLVITDPYASY